LALGLHSEAAEGAFLVADEEGVQRHSEPVLRLARRPIDKIQAATARLLQAQAGGALDRALDIGWQALRELGVAMPRHPGVPHIGLGLVSVKWALLGRDTAALLALPPLESPELEAALVLMERMVPPAFRSGSQLFPLLVLRPLQIALRSGNATVSSFAYASYGIMLSGVLGDLEGGHRFGRLALDLAARRHHDGYRSKALFVFGNFLQHWREPLLRSTETLFEAYRTGLASGNVFEALWAAVYRACWMFTAGVELGEVEAQLAAIGDLVRHDDTARTTAALLRQAVANLRGGPEGMTELSGLHYDETEAQARFARASDKIETFAFHLLKLRLWLLAGDPSRALGHAIEAEKYLEAVTAMPFVREIRFHGSVARLQASAPDALRHARRTLKLLRTWAQHEDSWAYRVDLLQALVARRRGDPAAARQACERALAGARRAGVLHDEVLASEIGAELHAGHPVLEGAMRENIVRALRQWGAQAQLSRLGVSTTNPRPDSDPTFPTSLRLGQVLPATPSGPQSLLSGSLSGSLGGSLGGPPSGTGSVSSSSTSRQGVLDLASALKAAATISAELQMERLLERLLRIILENAGAERGSLLLLDGAEPRVHAEGLADGTVQVHEGVAMAQAPWVCEPVVRFVARTSEPLVLADAQQDARFASVPYVRRHGIRSVLCAPVLHQGRLLALVYLENNLAPASFTPARLQVLTLLSGQAAVALENARLVANLDATVALRTRELNDRNQELRASLDHLADELSEAAAYVQSLLPAPTTGSPRISWRFVPSAHLGGDAFGYHWLAPGLLAFYLLDVAGHGIASALHSVTVLSALQSQRLPGVDFRRPGAVMAALNQTFPREQSGGFYFTAFYATLDVASGAIRFANGGHPPPTIIGPDGLRELDPTGPMVGVLPDMPYDEGDATLHPGERLFLFSDGVYELERPGGAMVTYEEFLEALRAEGRGDDKLAAMEQFARTCRGNRSLDDDFSMVLLEA
jgi:serine phosphatase RsbU (regulator of sigma subunit)